MKNPPWMKISISFWNMDWKGWVSNIMLVFRIFRGVVVVSLQTSPGNSSSSRNSVPLVIAPVRTISSTAAVGITPRELHTFSTTVFCGWFWKKDTWNAECPIFLGNFTPKTSNYYLKNRALGFPGTRYLSKKVVHGMFSLGGRGPNLSHLSGMGCWDCFFFRFTNKNMPYICWITYWRCKISTHCFERNHHGWPRLKCIDK